MPLIASRQRCHFRLADPKSGRSCQDYSLLASLLMTLPSQGQKAKGVHRIHTYYLLTSTPNINRLMRLMDVHERVWSIIPWDNARTFLQTQVQKSCSTALGIFRWHQGAPLLSMAPLASTCTYCSSCSSGSTKLGDGSKNTHASPHRIDTCPHPCARLWHPETEMQLHAQSASWCL